MPWHGGTAPSAVAVPPPKGLLVEPKPPVVPEPPAPNRGLLCEEPNALVVLVLPEPNPPNVDELPPNGDVVLLEAFPNAPPVELPKPVLVFAVLPNRPPLVDVVVPKPLAVLF